MTFSVPIETLDDIEALPDNTNTIESLTNKDQITTVLPRFIGTESTGRFVTAFFIFHGDDAQTVTLYTRQRTNSESTFEKQTTASLTKTPTFIGDTWNQTILIETPDIDTIERLKQRAHYDTVWLATSHDPDITFDEFHSYPFNSIPAGLPDCDHTKTTDPAQTPNLDITVTLCQNCGIPLVVATPNGGLEAHNTLDTEYIGIPTDEDTPVRAKQTTPTDPLTNAEVTLHVLSRYANVEQSHFDIYARNDHYGYLITLHNSVAGYALWNEFNDHIALQQIYIFPEFRGAHLGEILVDAWYDHIDADHYYAIGPNDVGQHTLSQAGHLDGGTAAPATILSCSDTLDAGAVNASYTDAVRRGNDPL